jgi:hypothetical protein
MLTIDRLRLQLPGEYRDRAHLIARMVAHELAEIPVGDSRKIERVSLPPITVVPGTVDRQIARQIAAAVQTRLNGKGKNEL